MSTYLVYLALSRLPIWLRWLRNFGWWLVVHVHYASMKEGYERCWRRPFPIRRWRWRPRPDLWLRLRGVVPHLVSMGYVRKRYLLADAVFHVFDCLTGMLLGVRG
jgi:hypothetical protein